MDGRRLIDGVRRIGAVLALLAVATFALLSAPSHAEPLGGIAAPAAVSAHQAADGDTDAAHHAPGGHCAIHCAGHVAAPALAVTPLNLKAVAAVRRRPADDEARATLCAAPPTRPPTA